MVCPLLSELGDREGQTSLLGKTGLAYAEPEESRCPRDVLMSSRLHEAQQKGTGEFRAKERTLGHTYV